jgi:uncharacterized DUF497 family protein
MGCGQSAQKRGEAWNHIRGSNHGVQRFEFDCGWDPEHSDVEEREITIGMSHRVNILVVVHTDRDDTIRVISARRANRKEREHYAENI